MLLLLLLVLALSLLYVWHKRIFAFIPSLGIPYREPQPIFGNVYRAIRGKVPMFQVIDEIYKEFEDTPLVGWYHFMRPRIMVKDPELLEHIFVKDFSVFPDRDFGRDPEKSPSRGLDVHLVNLRGARWRSLRTKLSPVFSSGKMKGMLSQLEECSDRMKDHLVKEIEKGGPLEAKHEISGYTMDVIASCAFGLNFNSIDDADSPLRRMAMVIFNNSSALFLLLELRRLAPRLLDFYGKLVSFFRPARMNFDPYGFTRNLIAETIRKREENSIVRPDFLHLMVELRKQEENRTPEPNEVLMDDQVIASNAFVFLVAGYETTATAISFILYELAVNPEVQDRLYKEIVDKLDKHNGELNWECLKEMQYLEQVASETLRLHPPAPLISRVSTKPYKFPNTNVEVPSGTTVSVPIYSFHYDPRHFPNPHKFDPDRFSEGNIQNIKKFTYLPFGDGPRICIGIRFAKMEMKMAVARLIQNFSVKVNPKTTSPLQYKPNTLVLTPAGGIWLDFSLRKKRQ